MALSGRGCMCLLRLWVFSVAAVMEPFADIRVLDRCNGCLGVVLVWVMLVGEKWR